MKKKLGAILLVVALVLALALPAAPVAATDVSIVRVSGTGTQSAGYTTTDPVADPLNASNYSGVGTWSDAVDLSSPNALWYDETLVTPAVWVSSADSPEGNTANDQWRLFKEEFDIPSGAVVTSAELYMSADNSVEAYLNGTSVGTADDAVFGAAPGPPFSDPADYHFKFLWGPFDLEPQVQEDTNTLMFVVRNWGSSGGNPTGLLYTVEIEYEIPDIEKTMASDGDLGDIITVTLDVENPYGYDLTVQDVIPDGLKYILGTFMVDSGSGPVAVIPTIVGNTISTTVGNGDHVITFDVQVVEVQCEDVDVKNWAYLYDGATELDKDDAEITLHPYEGFEKTFTIVYEDNDTTGAGQIEVNELVMWDMNITVPNNVGWDITDAVLKDNLGGELGMAGDDVDNDRDKPKKVDEDDGTTAWGDVEMDYNTLHGYPITIKTPGKSNKVHFWISGIDIDDGDPALVFVLGVFTDKNPSKHAHQSYTSTYVDHPLNSGATLKFTDTSEGGTGFLLSAHTCPVLIDVVPPIPLEP